MSDDIVGPAMLTADATTIGARISAEAHAAIDAKLAAWFGRESELGAYDADSVRELGKHVI